MPVLDDDDDILKQLAAQLGTLEEPEDVEDVTKIPDPELGVRVQEIDAQLVEAGQLLQPTTQEARDLHSLRGALLIEMSKRGLR